MALISSLLLTACGTDSLDRSELEDSVSQRMKDEANADRGAPDAVRCEGGLDEEPQRCTATVGADLIGLTVVPDDDADDYGWQWKFDPGLTIDADEVARRLEPAIVQQTHRHMDALVCADDLPGKPDATTTCEMDRGGRTYPVAVVVTGAEGHEVTFRFEIEEPS